MTAGTGGSTGSIARHRDPLAYVMYSPTRNAQTLRAALVGFGMLAGALSLVALLLTLVPPRVYQKDFIQEYVLARAVAERGELYLSLDQLVPRYLGMSLTDWSLPRPTPHPPTVGLLFLPMAALDYVTAARVWLVVELLCTAATVWVLARGMGQAIRPPVLAAVTLILIGWPPLHGELRLSQLNAPVLLGLAAACVLVREHPRTAGALLAFTLLLKPVLWPVLLLLVVRRLWNVLAAAVAVLLAGCTGIAASIGIHPMVAYATEALPQWSYVYQHSTRNLSLWSIGQRIFGGTENGISVAPLIPSPAAASIIDVGLPAIALLGCLVISRRMRLEAALGFMVCVSLLVSPILWYQYLLLVLVPAAYVLESLRQRGFPRRETYATLIVVGLTLVPFEWWSMAGGVLAGQPLMLSGPTELPFAASLLTLAPMLLVISLGWIVAHLSGSVSATEATPAA